MTKAARSGWLVIALMPVGFALVVGSLIFKNGFIDDPEDLDRWAFVAPLLVMCFVFVAGIYFMYRVWKSSDGGDQRRLPRRSASRLRLRRRP